MKETRTRRLLWITMLALVAAWTSSSHAQATYTVLYNFGTQVGDPATPSYSIVAQGRDGNLYSSTCRQNQSSETFDGAAFKITPTGTLSAFDFTFDFTMGAACPAGGLTLGSDGNVYGTSEYLNNGSKLSPYGTIFKMTPDGAFRELYRFPHGAFEQAPAAAPIQGTDGNFYGTTIRLGLLSFDGTIYKITPSGAFTTLFTFSGNETDGSGPLDPLVEGMDGNFYGTTVAGGSDGLGVIFKVSATGKFAVLHNFDGRNGSQPSSPLILGSDGNFYGTAYAGGASNNGLVFKMTPTGKMTPLHSMNGTTDGNHPIAGLVEATDGNFYGVNSGGASSPRCLVHGCGTIFSVTPTGDFSVLYNFDAVTGQAPETTLIQHTNGLLYGATQAGGTGDIGYCSHRAPAPAGCGVFFSLDVGLAPFIRLVNTTAKIGGTVQILGQGFTGTTAVALNGAAATFSVVSDTYLTATVPVGATTGFVTVTTPTGTLTSNKQLVIKPGS